MVFEAELFAINEALKQLIMRLWFRKNSVIFIESKSAVEAIINNNATKNSNKNT